MDPVGDITLTWGESLRWDERRGRLWFVDCATQSLHWVDDLASPAVATMSLPSMPTGLVLTEGDDVVVCLDDGLHVVDVAAGTTTLLAPYPPGMQGRANDANADGRGGLVTGTLNLAAAPGAVFRWALGQGWALVDDDVGNLNGPFALGDALIYSDTIAGVVYRREDGKRRVVGDHGPLGGAPDGATGDAGGGIWSCSVRAGAVVRFVDGRVDRVLDVPAQNPSDVCFGGGRLDQLFVVSIALDLAGTGDVGPLAGRLLVGEVPGVTGRPEHRVAL